MSYEDYVALVAEGEQKFEYVNGEAFAMAGGTPRHAAICANALVALATPLRGTPCRAYQSDLRVRVEATGLSTYPDLTVVCGPLWTSPRDPHAAINPRVIVEVTSGSTEAYDRGAKFRHYQALASLTDYLVVSSERAQIDHYRRQGDGTWLLIPVGPTDRTTTHLESLGVTLALDDVYAQLEGTPG